MGSHYAPSVCAGLSQTLLHGWRQGFPLQPSPYQELATRSGSTLREVLSLCQRLNHEGRLDSVHACWGDRLRRARWLHGFSSPVSERQLAELMAVHGCVGLERVQQPADGWPSLWITLEGRCDGVVQEQLVACGLQPGVSIPLLRSDGHCACDDGPCTDTDLAHAVEEGLPLVAHPYQRLAERLGRSERQVLARLREWQLRGDLQALSLAAPHHAPWQACASAWVEAPRSDELLRQLRTLPGMQAVEAPDGATPAQWLLRLHAPQELAAGLLQQALDGAGLAGRVRHRWEGLYCTPRACPQLFS